MGRFAKHFVGIVLTGGFAVTSITGGAAHSAKQANVLELVGEQHFGARGVGDYVILPENRVFIAGFWGGRVRRLGFLLPGEESTRDFQTNVGSISKLVYSRKERLLVVLGQTDWIELWDIDKPSRVGDLRGQRDRYYSLALAPDQQTLAAGTGEYPKWGEISLWDLKTRQFLKTIKDDKDPRRIGGHLMFTQDGRSILSGSGGGAVQLDLVTGAPLATFDTNNKEVTTISVSPNNRLMALGLTSPSENGRGEIWVFDLSSRRRLAVLTKLSNSINTLVFSRDHRFLSAGAGSIGGDGYIYLWRTSTWGKLVHGRFHFDRVLSIQFTQDSGSLISADGSGFLKFWRINDR